jgi:HEAT repeat protein
MISVCPACWRTVGRDDPRCPSCGADLRTLDDRPFPQKLVAALDHPDRETVMRVAQILGDRQAPGSIPALGRALRRYWAEPYVAAAIVRALASFDVSEARELLLDALGHPSIIVRTAAALALQASPAARTSWRRRP